MTLFKNIQRTTLALSMLALSALPFAGRWRGPRSRRADLLQWLLIAGLAAIGLSLLWSFVLNPIFFQDNSCVENSLRGVMNAAGTVSC